MYGKKFSKARRRRIRRAAAAAAVVVTCAIFLLVSPVCAVTDVKMNGNFHETAEEVTGLLGRGPFSRSSVLLFLFNRGRKIGGNTFVDTLTVDLEDLHSVTVNVSEKKLIGCVEYDGRYWYFNRTGTVLVSTESAGNAMQDPANALPAAVSVESQASSDTQAVQGTGTDASQIAQGTGTVDSQPVSENAQNPQDSAEADENSPGELLDNVTDAVELASVPGSLSGVKIIYLAADPALFGDEYPEEADGLQESPVGEAEAYEEVPTKENEGGSEEGISGEEWTGEDEVTGEEQEVGSEPEEASYAEDAEYSEDAEYAGDTDYTEEEVSAEENGEEDAGEDEESGEMTEEEVAPEEIIQPAVVTEEDMPAGNDDGGAQTWDLDTSAKGGNYLPLVRGLVFSEAAVGYPLPVQYDRVFSSIAVLKSFVDRSGYVPDVVEYDADGDLTVTYGEAVINLGKGENIESRVSVMGKTLPSIAGLSGTLHLENCDGTQNRFIFSKN